MRFTQRRIFTGVVILLFIASFLPVKLASTIASLPHWFLQAAVAPPATVLSAAGSSFRPGTKRKLVDENLAKIQEQFGEALAYNRQLESQNAKLRSQISRLTRSSLLIGLDKVDMIDCRVTSLSSGAPAPILIVDRGKSSGVSKGKAVVSGFNLVGKVISAGPLTAQIKLITAPKAGFSVRIVPPSAKKPKRELDAWVEYKNKLNAFVLNISVHKQVKIGDLAHLNDSRWPAQAHGFIVGKVVKIEKDPKNPLNLKNVIIKPLTSLEHLHRVTVLKPK